MYEIKTEFVYEDFSSDNEKFDFRNYSTKSKYYGNSKKLIIGKIKAKFDLKPKIYSFFVDDNSEHKKAKRVNRNGVTTISHNELKMYC